MATRTLNDPEAVAELVDEIGRSNARRGYAGSCECSSVVAAAGEFAGWGYRITRELTQGWIDCSSLVSQAHWAGAGLGTPFVAETQRLASSATAVVRADLVPGDVLVRYPSRRAAPGGRHNHVVLFAGWDETERPWALESAPGVGVRARPLTRDDGLGGIRRFLPFPRVTHQNSASALALARSVPKLARLGARLTAGLAASRRHRGVDVFVRDQIDVIAPMSGTVLAVEDSESRVGATVVVASAARDAAILLRPIVGCEVRVGAKVSAGARIGLVGSHRPWGCNAIPALRDVPRLHWEYWSSLPAAFASETSFEGTVIHDLVSGARSYNPIYAHKLGDIGSPFRAEAAASLVALPRRGSLELGQEPLGRQDHAPRLL